MFDSQYFLLREHPFNLKGGGGGGYGFFLSQNIFLFHFEAERGFFCVKLLRHSFFSTKTVFF